MEVIRRSSVFAAGVMEAFDYSPSDKELVFQAKALCRDYIHSRLNLYGLGSSKTQVDSTPCEVSAVLLCLGDELECMRPSVYRNVAKQLNISVAMETTVSDAFVAVATEIFSAGITWGKVVSMYAVAGALAVDCVRQNQPATVQTIVDSLGHFVRKNLAHWLKKRGGWADIKNCVVKVDAVSQTHWLSPVAESCKHFLSTLYIYIMKES
ncbi:bcl-2-related ovarian killer protein homolog A isoform X1 [Esox lucius]|uniref:Bcl-2 Bcl-2 homology region 1-3 domain-containing protein n=2 Tax=Esox lucius TaxID=8010 RepID=A0A3P8Z3P5_ESOLU|nr:bcl-2-related ovarian killer protein homolog A isoform X1 [Esox lucius]XP_012996103.1 bcl-2-related ovarian killer protein homolog A isoform X1 [Esox lucius]XP_012996104.1 bcl-2-related ovarian killer protein homolog A isoform X1 [Esox lucius]